MNKRLPTLDKEPVTDQSTDTTNVQFGEPVNFTGVTYRSIRGDLQVQNGPKISMSSKSTQHG